MSSGVAVSADCAIEYGRLKSDRQYRYLVFKMVNDNTEIVVDVKGARDSSYDDLVAHLRIAEAEEDCRFAVYDVDFTFKGQPKNKLIFIAWSPDKAKIKQKMVYTSSKMSLKKKLQIELEQQATDLEELSFDAIVERCSRALKD